MGADVATVVIGGKIVIEDHQPRTIDVEGLYREERAFCAKGDTPEQRAHADLLQKIKPYVQAWYRTWHQAIIDQPSIRSIAEPRGTGRCYGAGGEKNGNFVAASNRLSAGCPPELEQSTIAIRHRWPDDNVFDLLSDRFEMICWANAAANCAVSAE